MKQRGVFEKEPGSGVWWIRYADASGRIRREKVGAKSHALQLYRKRKTEVSQGVKLPENLRRRPVLFYQNWRMMPWSSHVTTSSAIAKMCVEWHS